jgi:hypothetical protein
VWFTVAAIGGAVGLAVLATVASAVTRSSRVPATQALTDGFSVALLVAAGLGLAAALAAWALVRERDCQSELARRNERPDAIPVGSSAHIAACQPGVVLLANQPPQPDDARKELR